MRYGTLLSQFLRVFLPTVGNLNADRMVRTSGERKDKVLDPVKHF